MERDEQNRGCDQPAEDLPEKWAAFWGNQLQRLKRRAEEQANRTSTSSTRDDKLRLEPGRANGH